MKHSYLYGDVNPSVNKDYLLVPEKVNLAEEPEGVKAHKQWSVERHVPPEKHNGKLKHPSWRGSSDDSILGFQFSNSAAFTAET